MNIQTAERVIMLVCDGLSYDEIALKLKIPKSHARDGWKEYARQCWLAQSRRFLKGKHEFVQAHFNLRIEYDGATNHLRTAYEEKARLLYDYREPGGLRK